MCDSHRPCLPDSSHSAKTGRVASAVPASRTGGNEHAETRADRSTSERRSGTKGKELHLIYTQ